MRLVFAKIRHETVVADYELTVEDIKKLQGLLAMFDEGLLAMFNRVVDAK